MVKHPKNGEQDLLSRLTERKLYEAVMIEIERGERDYGVWGQAIVESDGNEQKARAIYIQLRVAALRDDMILEHEINEREKVEAVKRRHEEDEKKKREFQRLRLDGKILEAPFHRYSENPATVHWVAKQGQAYNKGDLLCELQVNKTQQVILIRADRDLVLTKIIEKEGSTISEYQQVLGHLD